MLTRKTIMLFLAILLSVTFSTTVFAQDRAFDRYKHYVSLANNGLGFAESEDAATLGWAESQYLDSYIDIYNRYRDTYWLDKFAAVGKSHESLLLNNVNHPNDYGHALYFSVLSKYLSIYNTMLKQLEPYFYRESAVNSSPAPNQAPRKKESIAFHKRMGFIIEPQEQSLEDVPVCLDYDGRGGNRVIFKKLL